MKIKISYFHIDMTSLEYINYSEINDSSSINMTELEKKKNNRHNITIKKRHDTGANNIGANNIGANNIGANNIGANNIGANNIGSPNADTSENAQNMLNLINNLNGYENDDSNGLADFNPPPRAEVSSKTPTMEGQNTMMQGQNTMMEGQNTIMADYEKPTTIQHNNDENKNTANPRQYPAPLDSYEGFNALPKTYASDYYKQYVPYFNQSDGQNMNKGQILEKLNYMIHLLEEQKDEKTGHVIEEVILYSFLGVFIIFIVDSFARVGKYTR